MCYTVYLKGEYHSAIMFGFLLLLVLRTHIQAKPYKIKNSQTNTYIGLEGKYPTWLSLEKSNTFNDKPSKVEGRVIIEVVEILGKVWNIEGYKTNLIYYPESNTTNEIFLIENLANGRIRISNDGECITFVESNNRFEKLPCVDGTVAQEFLIADENGITARTPDFSPGTEDMSPTDESGSDQSTALGIALGAYLEAGGESGGLSALAAAAKGFSAAGGSANSMEIGTMDALLIAVQAYLRSAGVANASKMNASQAMAALARVHPITNQYHSMETLDNPIFRSLMATNSRSSFGSPPLGMEGNSMYSPFMSSSHASLYNPMMNPYFRQNFFDPFETMGTGHGFGTPMPYYMSSILQPSSLWGL